MRSREVLFLFCLVMSLIFIPGLAPVVAELAAQTAHMAWRLAREYPLVAGGVGIAFVAVALMGSNHYYRRRYYR